MKFNLTTLALVIFTTHLAIIAEAKPKKYLIETENEDVSKDVTSTKMVDPVEDVDDHGGAMKAVAEGNAIFGLHLHEALAEGKKGNLLMSPYSLSMAMAMLQVGARNKTRLLIRRGMHFPEMKKLMLGYKDVRRIIMRYHDKIDMEVANQLFVKEGFQMLDKFRDDIEDYFHFEITQTDFTENEGQTSRKLINDWVERNTNEKIKNLIPIAMLNNSTSIVLVNAIYFKGDWLIKFDSNKTKDEKFYVNENKTVQVPMMRNSRGKFKMITPDEEGDFFFGNAIELPYIGNRVSMYIILPELGDLQDMEKFLAKNEDILDIFGKIDGQRAMDVNLALPKFKIEKTMELSKIMAKKLAMKHIFIDEADFSGISETENLSVSDVIQKAFIEVNEEGSEAAAATKVQLSTVSLADPEPPSFVCNTPFIFYIRDKMTNMVLFSGRVMDPTAG